MGASAGSEAGSDDVGAGTVADSSSADGPAPVADAPAAPVADAWKAPPREQWEALQRRLDEQEQFAKIGQEFAPHVDRIRNAMFQAPAQAAAPGQPEAPSPYDRDYESFLTSPTGFQKYLKDAGEDPRVFERGVLAIAGRKFKSEFGELKALKAQYEQDRKALDKELAEMRGFRRVAEHQFAESPRWQKHGREIGRASGRER